MNGKFVISLDFELHWGAVEKYDLNVLRKYFLDTRESIPHMLSIFEQNGIKATWATVGYLFAKNKEQILKHLPTEKLQPSYVNSAFSSYNYIDKVGKAENDDPFHYASSLIRKIIETKGQEIASHTFSHYYCNESGQTLEQFDADLRSAVSIAKDSFDITLNSLVFPRNQFNASYLEVAKNNGFKVVRSNPNVYFWNKQNKVTPLFRAFDTLMPISKSLTFSEETLDRENEVVQLPSSRFFRPYMQKEKAVQKQKISRIKKEMTYAAHKGEVYHIWWHPHNFGNDVPENIKQLKEIINHFNNLRKEYNFESVNMRDFIL